MALKALLVGINAYTGLVPPLLGCVNDVRRMRELLEQRYQLAESQMHILVDEQATRAAILAGLEWLATHDNTCTPPIRLFHFSGHGTYIADQNGDEPDGLDECIVPYDYATTGPINDDVLRTVYDTFPRNTHLVLTMDCCHSGSNQFLHDTRYRYLEPDRNEWRKIRKAKQEFRARRNAFISQQVRELRREALSDDAWEQRLSTALQKFDKQSFGQEEVPGITVLLSACHASQMAADAPFEDGYCGAFTYYLTQLLREHDGPMTYLDLIEQLGTTLHEHDFQQQPQLECSHENMRHLVLS